MAVSVLLMLTELVLTGVVGFQMYLFKQISACLLYTSDAADE